MNIDLCRELANGTAAVEQYVGLFLFAITIAVLAALALTDPRPTNRKER